MYVYSNSIDLHTRCFLLKFINAQLSDETLLLSFWRSKLAYILWNRVAGVVRTCASECRLAGVSLTHSLIHSLADTATAAGYETLIIKLITIDNEITEY